jgi:hypothetical protein
MRPLIFLAIAVTGSACNCSGSPSGCPKDTIPACVDGGVPSYATQVQPLFQSLCVICHAPGTTEGASRPMYDFTYVHANSGPLLDDIYDCHMPPWTDAGQPMFVITEQQRQIMLSWLACGAPNN